MGKTKTKTVLEPVGEVIKIKKVPKCCIKGCDKDGTHGLCTLLMCKGHHDKARD